MGSEYTRRSFSGVPVLFTQFMASSVSHSAATPLFLPALTVYLSWGTFTGFLGMCGIWSCVFGAFALPVLAQVLTITWCRVAEVAVFSPIPRFFTLVLGLSILFKEFLALALVFLGCTQGVAFSLRMPLLRLGHRLRWLALWFALRTSSLVVPAVVCGSFLGRRSCVFFLSSCWVWDWLLLSH